MKLKDFAKKGLVLVAMTFMFALSAEAQQKRLMDFQMLMSTHETAYKDFITRRANTKKP